MNKIFRIVFNVSTGTWVVASEMAKGRKKSGSSGTSGAILFATLSLGALTPAFAGSVDGGSAPGGGSEAIGPAAQATGLNSLAISASGMTNKASGEASITIGQNVTASGLWDITLGADSATSGTASLAIGQGVQATQDQAIGIGQNAVATGISTVALGGGAQATAGSAVAVGNGARTDVADSVAIGHSAYASKVNSVAIGTNSLTDGNMALAAYNPGSAALSGTASVANGQVSIGKSGSERRLVNVAAGSAATDAVNVSQLQAEDATVDKLGGDAAARLGGGATYSSTTGAISAPSYTLANANTIGGTSGAAADVGNGFAKVDTALGVLNTTANKGFNISADAGATSQNIAPGATAKFAAGTNATVSRSTDTITYGVVNNPTFSGLITANGGFKVGASQSIDMGANKVTNVADATLAANNKDAATGGQLYTTNSIVTKQGTDAAAALGGTAAYNSGTGAISAPSYTLANANTIGGTSGAAADVGNGFAKVDTALGVLNTTANKGFNISADAGATSQNIAPGATAKFAAGTNATVSRSTDTITYGVVNNPTFSGLITANGGFKVGASQTIDMGANKVTNVADATLAANNKDAATGGQLYTTNQIASKNGTDTAAALGGTAAYNSGTGAISAPSYTLANANTIGGTSGAAADVGNGFAKVDTALGVLNTTANKGFNISADAGATSQNIAPGATAKFAAGTNATVSRAGDTITYGVVANPTFAGLLTANGGLKVGASQSVDMGANKITNVANGTAATDAVNKSQLDAAVITASGGSMTFTGNDATAGTVSRTLGDTLAIKGVASTTGLYSGNNIKTVTDPVTGAINMQMADAPKFGNVVVNDTNSGKITGLTDGSIASGSKEAVTGGQLYTTNQIASKNGTDTAAALGGTAAYNSGTGAISAPSYTLANANTIGGTSGAAADVGNGFAKVDTALGVLNTTANKGFNISADAGATSQNIAPGATAKFAAGTNATVSRSTDTITFGVVNNPTFSGLITANGGFRVGASQSIDMGANKVTNVADATLAANNKDAATGGQLYTTNSIVTKQGTDAAAALGGTAAYNSGTGAISAPSYTLANANTIGGTTGAAADVGDGFAKVDTALGVLGTTVNKGINISADAGATSQNIAPGATVNFAAGTNATVSRAGDTVTYGVVANPTFSGLLTANGGFKVGASQSIDMGANKVTNVADATLAANNKDAVTGGQLYATNQAVAQNVTDIGALDGRVTTAEGNITTIQGDVSTINTNVSNIDARVTNNEGDISTLNTNVSNIDSRVTNVEGSVTNITNQFNSGELGLVKQDATSRLITVASDSDGGEVNFAGTAGERKLTGVADGAVAAGSKEAVNGGQLDTTNQAVAQNASDIGVLDGRVTTAEGDISTIQGDVSTINTNISNIDGRVTTSESNITNLDGRVTQNEGDISTIQGDVSTLNTNVSNIDGRVTNIEGSVTNITNQLTTGEIGLVKQDATSRLITVASDSDGGEVNFAGTAGERKLTGVADGTVAAGSKEAVNGGQLDTTNQAVAQNASDIGALDGRMTTAEGNITDLDSRVTQNEGDISTIQGDVSTINTNISNIDGRVTTAESNITNLDGRVTNNEGDITTLNTNVSNIDGRVTNIEGSVTNITNQLTTGEIGLVKQDATSRLITVAADSDGGEVNFAGTAGERKLTGVADGTVAAGSKEAVNGGQLDTTNQAVAQNASDIGALDGRMTTAEGNITDLDSRVTQNEGDISTIQGDVSTINTNISNIDGRVTQNEGDISTLNTSVSNIDGRVTTAESNITNLDNRVTQNEGDITTIQGDVSTINTNISNIDGRVTQNEGDISTLNANVTNITNQLNTGEIGLVKQDASSRLITVASGSDGGEVNFAGTAGERRLTGVADGTVAAGSKEAVNGSQLDTTNQAVAQNASDIGALDGRMTTAEGNITTIQGDVSTINTNISNIDGRVTNAESNITNLDNRVTQNEGDISTIQGDVSTLNTNVSNIDGRVTNIEGSVTNITNQLTTGEIGLVKQDATSRLITVAADSDGTEVNFAGTAGERKLTGVADGTVAAGSKEAVNGGQLDTTNQAVAQNASHIGALDGRVTTAEGNITTIQGDVSTINTNISNLDGRVTQNEGDITTLNTNVTNITNQLNTGEIGLVKQDATSRLITVASGSDGGEVNFAGAAGERKLTGVANGTVAAGSKEAVNGGQLDTTNQAVAQNASDIGALDGRVTTAEGDISTIQGDVSTINTSISNLDGRVTQNEGDITNLDGRVTQNEGDITTLNTNVSNIYGRVTTAESNITNLDGRVTQNEGDISTLNTNVTNITNQLNTGEIGLVKQDATSRLITVAAGSDGGEVNFAGTAGERKLTGVANGTVAAGSKEAVNGGQLDATNQAVAQNASDIGALDGRVTTAEGNIATIQGDVSTINTNISNLDGRVTQNEGDITTLNTNVSNIDGRVTTAESNITNLDNRVTQNEGDISTIQGDVSTLNTSVANITNQLNTGEIGLVKQDTTSRLITVAAGSDGGEVNFAGTAGERKLTGVANGTVAAGSKEAVNGGQLDTTNQAVAQNASDIGALDGRVSNAEGNITTIQGDVSTINTNISNLDGRVTQNEGDITTINTNVSNLDGRVTTAEGNITTLQGDVSTINTNVTNITNQLNTGEIGLVKQDATSRLITVASGSDGGEVNFAGTAGERKLTGVANGNVAAGSKEAVNGGQLYTTEQNVAQNGTDIRALDGRMTTAEGNITTIQGDVATINTNIGSLDGRVTQNEGDIATLNTNVSNIDGRVTTAEGNITNLDSRVTRNEGDITTLNTNVSNIDGRVTNVEGSMTHITNQLNNGEIGLVQYDAASDMVTVAAGKAGAAVNFRNSTGASRRLLGVAAGAADEDAVNVSQLSKAMGGTASYDPATGAYTGPVYTMTNADGSTTQVNGVGGALGNIDARVYNTTTQVQNIATQLSSGTIGMVQQSAAGANLTVGKDADGAAVDFAGTAGARRLVSVADGTVAARSQEAVNGGQLHTVAQSMATAIGGGSTVNTDGSISAPTFTVTNADGSTSQVHSMGEAVTSIDNRVTNVDNRMTNVEGSITSITKQINEGGVGLVKQDAATQDITIAKDTGGTSVNVAGTAGDRSITGVASGVADNDAVNVAQLKKAGVLSEDGQAKSVIAYDTPTSITLGGPDATAPVALHNVADGTADHDAVNVSQLNQRLDRYTTEVITQANDYTDQRIGDVWSGMEKVAREVVKQDRRISAQGAMSIAQSQMAAGAAAAAVGNPNGAWSVGLGYEQGQGAFSAGYAKPIGKASQISFGASVSGNDSAVGMGFAHKL